MKDFINGFSSWHETHFEIVAAITFELQKQTPAKGVLDRLNSQGKGGLYELASELTDEFENLHEDTEWDGDFFDVIEEFIHLKFA